MAEDEAAEHERMRRFRDAALPYLDDVFTLARYLVRNPADAEDAAQECYVRALRHFDSYRGPAMKPWLLAILRNVCNDEFARRRDREIPTDYAEDETPTEAMPAWQEAQASPEGVMLKEQDDATIRRLVAELPEPFREIDRTARDQRSFLSGDRRGFRCAGRNGDVAAGAGAHHAAFGVERRGKRRRAIDQPDKMKP